MTDPRFNIVLLNPEIPNNTGNIGRTAVATGCRLHVIHPIGFDMSEKARRRAGLDYWHMVDCREHESWSAFLMSEGFLAKGPQTLRRQPKLWLFTTRSERSHWDAAFTRGDYLLFGKESAGVPGDVHDWITQTFGDENRLRLPMVNEARSLNLATAVCAAVYEAWRQISPLENA